MEWLKQNKKLAALVAAGVLVLVAHFSGLDIGSMIDSAKALAEKLGDLTADSAAPAATGATAPATP